MEKKILTLGDFLRNQTVQEQDSSHTFIGIEDVDRHINNIRGGKLIVIGGRPMQGKSYVLDKILLNTAKENKVLFCSALKKETHTAESDRLRIFAGNHPEVVKNILTLCPWDLSTNDLLEYIELAARNDGIKYVLIDEAKSCFTGNIQKETNISNDILPRLKRLAVELNITVFCTYMTSWEADFREGCDGKIPLLYDFEGCADYADIVIGVLRPYSYDILQDENGDPVENDINIYLLKSRVEGSFDLKFKDACNE